jgi:hypothetical protein
VLAFVAATALATDGRYDEDCQCALTRESSTWTGAVPLASLVSLTHDTGGAPGLVGMLANGSYVRLAVGSTDVLVPIAAKILALQPVDVVDDDGSPCRDFAPDARRPPPGGWTSQLVAFDGSGQDVRAIAHLVRERSQSLRTCVDEGDRVYARPLTLDFDVAKSGDFDHAVVSGPGLAPRAASCMARRIEGWRTAQVQTGSAAYVWSIQLPGIPVPTE